MKVNLRKKSVNKKLSYKVENSNKRLYNIKKKWIYNNRQHYPSQLSPFIPSLWLLLRLAMNQSHIKSYVLFQDLITIDHQLLIQHFKSKSQPMKLHLPNSKLKYSSKKSDKLLAQSLSKKSI